MTQLAPSFTPGALPAVVVPSGSNTGFSAASFSTVVSRPDRLVGRDVADRDDLVVEAARVLRRRGALLRARAHSSCCSREIPSSRATCEFCWTMCSPSKRRREPVEDHRVDQLAVPEAIAEARLLQQVRRVRHRLHAAGHDDVDVAGPDHRVGDLDRADRRRAHLVDRVGRRLDRQAGRDRRLSRRRLARAALQHLAHDHVLRLAAARPRCARAPP